MIKLYGADAVRLFILSDSPPEKDIQWSETGMTSSYKFVQKFWVVSEKILQIVKDKKIKENIELEKFTNHAVDKINISLEKFRYNVIIAVFHEIYTFYNKLVDENKNYSNLESNFIKILIVMMPVMPHIVSECLNKMENKDELKWPTVNQKYLENEENNIVIQINGKKRSMISIKKDITENQLLDKIKEMNLVEKYLKDKKISKTIYVKERLINLIIK